MSIHSFHPPVRTLMGPGPSDVNPRILEAMSRPTIGHLDPEFIGMMDEMKDLLRYAFQTSNELTEQDAQLESCEVRTQTKVLPDAEGQVAVGLSIHSKGEGIIEDILVPVG